MKLHPDAEFVRRAARTNGLLLSLASGPMLFLAIVAAQTAVQAAIGIGMAIFMLGVGIAAQTWGGKSPPRGT
jgi:hypothetical protein